MEKPSDQETTMITPPQYVKMEYPPDRGLKDLLGFNGWQPEDRWLWFAVRLSLILFVIGVEVVIILAFAKLMLGL